jgi:hypothetical protein
MTLSVMVGSTAASASWTFFFPFSNFSLLMHYSSMYCWQFLCSVPFGRKVSKQSRKEVEEFRIHLAFYCWVCSEIKVIWSCPDLESIHQMLSIYIILLLTRRSIYIFSPCYLFTETWYILLPSHSVYLSLWLLFIWTSLGV